MVVQVLMTVFFLLSGAVAYAAGPPPITLAELGSAAARGEPVESRTVRGVDIVRVAGEGRGLVHLRGCMVLGPIEFTPLSGGGELTVIDAAILIEDSVVVPRAEGEEGGRRLYTTHITAIDARFTAPFAIKGTRVDGVGEFTGTSFASADFTGSTFTHAASFERASFAGRALFRGVLFGGPADYSGASFADGAGFSGAWFKDEALFNGTSWVGGRADFRKASFAGRTTFKGAVFAGPALFAGAEFGKWTDFDGSRFGGRTDFSDAHFIDSVTFIGAGFAHGASFAGARFEAWTSLIEARFGGGLDMGGVSFARTVEFRRVAVEGPATFTGARFGGYMNMDGVGIDGRADFTGAVFSKRARFNGAALGTAVFEGTRFADEADFRAMAVARGMYFKGASFGGRADFGRIKTGKDASFDGAVFGNRAVFSGAEFGRLTGFPGVEFGGGVTFQQARFGGQADFQNTFFGKDTFFGQSTFEGEVRFGDAYFDSLVQFNDTLFERGAYFWGAVFAARALFTRARFGGEALFRYTWFGETAYMNEVEFTRGANFRDSSFTGMLQMRNAGIEGVLDFRSSAVRRLDMKTYRGTHIARGRLDMRGARVGSAHIEDIVFDKPVDFSRAVFGVPVPAAGFVFPSAGDVLDWEGFVGVLGAGGWLEVADAKLTERGKHRVMRALGDALAKRALGDAGAALRLRRELELAAGETLKPLAAEGDSSGTVIFRSLTFAGDAYFIGTVFGGTTALDSLTFEWRADFTDAAFAVHGDDPLARFSLSYLNAREILIRARQLPPLDRWAERQIRSPADWEPRSAIEPPPGALRSLAARLEIQGEHADARELRRLASVAEGGSGWSGWVMAATLGVVDAGEVSFRRLGGWYAGVFVYFALLYDALRRLARGGAERGIGGSVRLSGSMLLGGLGARRAALAGPALRAVSWAQWWAGLYLGAVLATALVMTLR